MALKRASQAGTRTPHWTLYQLRHASVTANEIQLGREAAQYIAGHKSAKIYDRSAEHWAQEGAAQREAWWECD